MRFPDGAVRPAYNAQIAAAADKGIIVSIDMTDRRNDAGLAMPMIDDIVRRYGKAPDRLLLDTNYANDPAIRDRFIADARAKAHVQHPSTLAVYEAGQFENFIFYPPLSWALGAALGEMTGWPRLRWRSCISRPGDMCKRD